MESRERGMWQRPSKSPNSNQKCNGIPAPGTTETRNRREDGQKKQRGKRQGTIVQTGAEPEELDFSPSPAHYNKAGRTRPKGYQGSTAPGLNIRPSFPNLARVPWLVVTGADSPPPTSA